MLGETQPLIDQLDAVALACAQLVERLAPAGFESALEAFGATDPSALANAIHGAVLPETLSERERQILQEFQGMPVAMLEELLGNAFAGTSDEDSPTAPTD